MEQIEKQEIRPVGRPKLPETIIRELQTKITELETEIKTSNNSNEELMHLAEIVRIIIRAAKGLGADEDVFYGLINAKDIRERTRLDETGLLSHSAMRIAAQAWPEFAMFQKIAEMEDPYYISEDGEGRKEGILLRQAQSKIDSNLILNMPNTQGGVAQTEQTQAAPAKKKSIIDKVLRR
jgi:hypothetical protein